jgi:S1-C subfamily serine protease
MVTAPLRERPAAGRGVGWLLGAALLGGALLGGAARAGPEDAQLDVAEAARPGVVRIHWRHARFSDFTLMRNAVVLREDGLLLMAGPPPDTQGVLTATLADGKRLRATFLAGDAPTALSLLRVAATGLKPLALTPAPAPLALPEGERAFPPRPLVMPALGLPVVMVTGDGAVAKGAVRAWGRYGTLVEPASGRRVRSTGLVTAAMAVVDTDAGSPLLDPGGRVAGLVVGRRATVAPEEGAATRPGLRQRPEPVEALAVPAAVIRIVWPLLEKHGRVPRGALDVTTAQADATLREHLGLASGGHLVQELEPGGAAARAGLERLDVIVAVNGVPMRPGTTLQDVLLPFRPADRVRLDVMRAGELMRIPVTLGSR